MNKPLVSKNQGLVSPYIALEVVALALVMAIPALALWLPEQMLSMANQ